MTIGLTYLTGAISDRNSFGPVLFGASLIPLVAVIAVLTLVRNTSATSHGVVRRI